MSTLAGASLMLASAFSGMTQTAMGDDLLSVTEQSPQYIASGSLVICGGGALPSRLIDRFIELGGGRNARVVVVSTASIYADSDIHARLSIWHDRLCENQIASFDVLHTRSREQADDPEFSKVLDTATAVWFLGGNQNWVMQSYLQTKTEERFHQVLARGGVIGGTSAGAAIMSRCMIADGKSEPVLSTGFGFLPGAIVDQHFRKRERLDRLMRAMQLRPGTVGVGVDEGTALIVRGRVMETLGESDVQVCLSASAQRPAWIYRLPVGEQADLVALQRAALARADIRVADASSRVPDVQNGTLVIMGGGAPPHEVIDTFLSAAGGHEAPIVVITNAGGDNPPDLNSVCGWLSAAGAKNVHLLHTKAASDLSNPKIVSMLKEARGIWFTGGRQLVDAFVGTKIETMFHDVLRRGGVIGGTSSDAMIKDKFLVRGNAISNEEIFGEGYERGFGFLPGVAIDQHFTERNRMEQMTQLKKSHPEMIAVGVDESTAMIVRGSTMQVVGEHHVTVFDRVTETPTQSPEFAVLKPGDRYDFRQHRRMESIAEADATK